MAALPPYRLQTLLGLRERKKEECERALAIALAELKREQDRLGAMELELERMEHKRETLRKDYLAKAMAGKTGAQEAVRHNAYIEHLKMLEQQQKEAIADQRDVVAEHEEMVAQKRNALLAATQELKALEKHKEKWLEDVKKELAAKEEIVMDDIAQTIFLRAQGGQSRPPDSPSSSSSSEDDG